MSSKRQQIVDAVKARFALITVANGYQTDIGLRQTEHHPTSKGAGELPAHDIRDGAEPTAVAQRNAGTYERQLRVEVVAELVEQDASATQARQALADMEAAVGKDPKWGGLARYSIPAESEVTVDDEGQLIGAARLAFDVIYDRRPWEP